MTEPKKFSRGSHSYTKWGSHFKEVKVRQASKKEDPPKAAIPPLAIDIDDQTSLGVYSNVSIVHQSNDDVVVDFAFERPDSRRARVRSRVVLPYPHVEKLILLLNNAVEEMKKKK